MSSGDKSSSPTRKQLIVPTPALDGARVLWRRWDSFEPAREGWLREFSANGRSVRICKTQSDKRERGEWYLCRQIRIEEVLDPASAPDESRPKRDQEGDE